MSDPIAIAEERLRIARELHDAVGHKVSLMVISAQALEAQSTGAARGGGASIADLGREAMEEMRATVSLMRPPGEARRARTGASLASSRDWSTGPAGSASAPSCASRASAGATRYPRALRLPDREEALANVARHSGARNARSASVSPSPSSGSRSPTTDTGRGASRFRGTA